MNESLQFHEIDEAMFCVGYHGESKKRRGTLVDLWHCMREEGKEGVYIIHGVSSAFDRLSCIRKGKERDERYLAAWPTACLVLSCLHR